MLLSVTGRSSASLVSISYSWLLLEQFMLLTLLSCIANRELSGYMCF